LDDGVVTHPCRTLVISNVTKPLVPPGVETFDATAPLGVGAVL
jgi:hypothetical protein